jgi:outer membrane protein W
MLRKLLVPALGLALLPAAAAQAQRADSDYGFDPGNWELTIAGSGSNDNSFTATQFNVQGSLGYFFTDALEVGVRQDVGYSDLAGSSWLGSTDLFADWHFDLGQWQPFVGANVGYLYGDGVNDTWFAAPEAGVKYFLNNTTFIQVRAEYQFLFDSGSSDNGFNDGRFVYSLALGVKF